MANPYTNKVVLGNETLIDLTGDTVTAGDILSGKKAHSKSGAPITGTCSYDADTRDATAAASNLLKGKTAYVNGSKITGTAEVTISGNTLIMPQGLVSLS